VMHTFKEKVTDEAKKAAVMVHKEEVEAKKCRSNIHAQRGQVGPG
jgi:hypothetical protein